MPQPHRLPLSNLLLLALPADDLGQLVPKLEPVKLSLRQQVEKPNEPISQVYFVESGIVSMVAKAPHGKEVEAGLIGRDGLTGSSLLLEDGQTPLECFTQVEGSALRLSVRDFRQALEQSAALKSLCARFARTLHIQTAYTALANAQSKLEERLARWILMIHDRVDGDSFEATHEFLALMLAVRRPGVTVALHALEGKGLIRSNRNEVVIKDREGLIELADGVYALPEKEYERLMGFPLTRRTTALEN